MVDVLAATSGLVVGVGRAVLDREKDNASIERKFKGQTVVVQVLAEGFQYQDRFYRSLSAIARQVTGTQWNGYAFFHVKTNDGGSE